MNQHQQNIACTCYLAKSNSYVSCISNDETSAVLFHVPVVVSADDAAPVDSKDSIPHPDVTAQRRWGAGQHVAYIDTR